MIKSSMTSNKSKMISNPLITSRDKELGLWKWWCLRMGATWRCQKYHSSIKMRTTQLLWFRRILRKILTVRIIQMILQNSLEATKIIHQKCRRRAVWTNSMILRRFRSMAITITMESPRPPDPKILKAPDSMSPLLLSWGLMGKQRAKTGQSWL